MQEICNLSMGLLHVLEAGHPRSLWHFMNHSLFPDIVYLHSFRIHHVEHPAFGIIIISRSSEWKRKTNTTFPQ